MARALRERINLGKVKRKGEIPYLIEIQRQSYALFLQADSPVDKRKNVGLEGAFRSVFPIIDYNEMASIEYMGYNMLESKYRERECIDKGLTYSAPIKIKVKLNLWNASEDGKKKLRESREEEVYIGEIPLMSETGSFIINGIERVIVSQLHRSPGVFFNTDKTKTHTSGRLLYTARVIPSRGSWLDFEFDSKDILYVRIDRRKKLPATIVLKALGYSNEDLLKIFYPVEEITIHDRDKLTRKVSPILTGTKTNTPITDQKTKEIIVKEGVKITKAALNRLLKAGVDEIPIPREEIVNRISLHDIVDPETGEIIVEGNELISEVVFEKILLMRISKLGLLFIDNVKYLSSLRDTLLMDKISTKEDALLEIYKKLRPGEPPTIEAARVLFDGLFFDERRYDLSPVGRLKVNKRLGLNEAMDKTVLTASDLIEIIKYLLALRTGQGEVDDIDHLGNRRVRSVGELLENQFRIGLVRMERAIKEKMMITEINDLMPHDIINAKPVMAAVKEFFGSSQLSQFMDQTNPLSEITHKRRLSALGPGGLTRERVGFEVRDVHPTHYGRICPIETPEGPNIGLITSLATYARVNEYGFMEAPYRKVDAGKVSDEIHYLSAIEGEKYVIAEATSRIDENGYLAGDAISARLGGDIKIFVRDDIQYMDVSPKQIVGVSASLIPFLENDDANRALMGSNMQRQAVPLIQTEAPIVGTGMEFAAARDSGAIKIAKRSGAVESIDANRIVVRTNDCGVDIYNLVKFARSNQATCINQRPLVTVGDVVEAGDVISDGSSTESGELALGRNVLVAFMPWGGYNFEDAILLNERLVKDDVFTSIHIEEFEVEARDTKLGPEEITRDIPNVGEDALSDLDDSGVIYVGAEVQPGDILVGKITPKGETQLTPEEKLLRAIFGEKAEEVKESCLYVPPGVKGTVVNVKVFTRKGIKKDNRAKSLEDDEIRKLQRDFEEETRIVARELNNKIREELNGKTLAEDLKDPKTKELLYDAGTVLEGDALEVITEKMIGRIKIEEETVLMRIDDFVKTTREYIRQLQLKYDERIERLKKGDELPPGVNKLIKVYIAMKRKIQVGDKMAGRHGNKGVVAMVIPWEDMPYLPDGTPLDIVLNPLGVPSRMNVGQILETHLGWAAKALGFHVAAPVFEGVQETELREMLTRAGMNENGQTILYDGRTGEPFERPVTVGYMYMLKLHHLVEDKLHARSIGPYSLVTQQPLGGKAQFGGQRLGEMEVWALEAYGASYSLQEFLTVKSDDVSGRAKMYEAIVKGDATLEPGVPESFHVLIKELQSLCLDVELLERKGPLGSKELQDKTPENIYSLYQKPRNPKDFEAIRIRLASPDKIREWSFGEVKKPETINYRTFKPEKDGLFCAKIFGPVKDWECICGKYKRMKHRGVVCDKCGVEVIQSKVRRERLAHIELCTPVAHIWFLKGVPSRIGMLLDMTMKNLEKVLYFESYVVIDPQDTTLKERQILSDEEYKKYTNEFGTRFKAGMGAEAIRELLRKVDVETLSVDLKTRINEANSIGIKKKLTKRLKIVEAFKFSGNKPEWMILDVIPVLPPDLRPLVPLQGGRFATSDLNDLYRRVINRNNRLRRLLELKAPSVIIKNEKRMLQEAIDALFDNTKGAKVPKSSTKRSLKSLSDMIKGKQGRFRQNLLGKRVDYSGRSVIVVGPELKLHQCGIPKQMALELFKPFIFNKLEEKGYVTTIKQAKKFVEMERPEVWDALEEVIKEHPVLLNRAPTLHRLGIQAFDPMLIEGKAIKLHPLVCTAYNADFDGDQMAVHIPLSIEAQVEARVLMMSINNLLSPASGKPIVLPTQDMVLGLYYLTKEKEGLIGEGKVFSSMDEVRIAYDNKKVLEHTKIKVLLNGQHVNTTVGRVLFYEVVPKNVPFTEVNRLLTKKEIQKVIDYSHKYAGRRKTVEFLDNLKRMGFEFATRSGISICISDMHIPSKKAEILKEAEKEVMEVYKQYADGLITNGERYNKVIDIWANVTEKVAEVMMAELGAEDGKDLTPEDIEKSRAFNSVFMMADSGARGSAAQIRQLAGMRGLMAKPSGEIIETPITANFREGLSPLQYFTSTHGARKGLADTALKTANSGYLTRRLVDVAQDVIITEVDCGTDDGILITALIEGGEIIQPLEERLMGRLTAEDIKDPLTGEVIMLKDTELNDENVNKIVDAGVDRVKIRSVLTCQTRFGICANCYGRDLARNDKIEMGEAVGIIAAQSIGEPGTQLTMRTFHIGGAATKIIEQAVLASKHGGNIKFVDLNYVTNREGLLVVMNRNAFLAVVDDNGREREKHNLVYGAKLLVKEGDKVVVGQKIAEWDPYSTPILTEVGGRVAWGDIEDGVSVKEQLDEITGLSHKLIVDFPPHLNLRPRISIKDEHGKSTLKLPSSHIPARYMLPAGANVLVERNDIVAPGDILAKIPRETIKTKDITGGLPRVAELFEARKPKEPTLVSEIDGVVEFVSTLKGSRVVKVKGGDVVKEYTVPKGKHVTVHEGDWVRAGEALMDGAVNPHDILDILGPTELQRYLVDEVQKVYRLQGVAINDKHIEIIIRQMMRKVRIEDAGNTELMIGEQVDRIQFQEHNALVMANGGRPAIGKPLLLGITKASLTTYSWVSAASFQETTRVLTDAALAGLVDDLKGLKENVIMGKIIPCGTGMERFKNTHVRRENYYTPEQMPALDLTPDQHESDPEQQEQPPVQEEAGV
nr:DNA-directed RNA polymerase subunit beta [Candidatus Magnetobacterium casensis]